MYFIYMNKKSTSSTVDQFENFDLKYLRDETSENNVPPRRY